MGELVVSMFVSLDGVLQAPGGPEEDTDDGFEQGGWQAPFFDEASGALITQGIEGMDALLLGRKTYDLFAGYWPNGPEGPIAKKMNSVPKYVASRTLETVEWQNASLIQGDVVDAIPELKGEHGEVRVIGSGNLVQTLLKHDLVDRYELWIYPVILGSGKRLFAEGAIPSALELVDTRSFDKGAVLLAYKRVGKPTYGDLADPPGE